MKRGANEAETCALNGWEVGTILRGHERWGNDDGVWTTIRITTIRITAIGESSILARCIRHERTTGDTITTSDAECRGRENSWTLRLRDWREVPQGRSPVARLFDAPPCDWWRYVPCRVCNARRQEPCQTIDGPARGPHASRRRFGEVLHGTLWLLTSGYAGDVLGDETPESDRAELPQEAK